MTAEPYRCRECGYEAWNLGGKKRHGAKSGHRGWVDHAMPCPRRDPRGHEEHVAEAALEAVRNHRDQEGA